VAKFFQFSKGRKVILKSPFSGKVVTLDCVRDEVFAKKMVGDGIAIEPTDDYLKAPIAGNILHIFPTGHALGMKTKDGLEILVHIGIDSIVLKGKGFTILVKEGEDVKPKDKLIKVDWPLVKGQISSIVSPLIITNMEKIKKIEVLKHDYVTAGEDLLQVVLNI
jgi:PTS system glucose-specific IIA component